MKLVFALMALMFSSRTFAAPKTGSCTMGTGEAAVKVSFVIDGASAQVTYEESDDEPSECSTKRDSDYDYRIECDGDEDDDKVIFLIKGNSGSMRDSDGDTLAQLRQCRIR